MKYFLHSLIAILVLFLTVQTSMAQKIEVSAGVSGNLTNYSGSAASSNIQYGTFPVFSKTLTAGFGVNAQIKLVAKSGFIYGLQIGYDELRTKANVNSIVLTTAYPGVFYTINTPYLALNPVSASGYETNTSKLINVNPYLGYRFKKRKWSMDVMAGAELGFIVENREHQVSNSPYNNDDSFYYTKSPNDSQILARQDHRLKGMVGVNYKRFVVDLSYAHGINTLVYKNPQTLITYTQGSAYSQVIRLGVAYRIF